MQRLTKLLRVWVAIGIYCLGEVFALGGVLLIGLANWIVPDDYIK